MKKLLFISLFFFASEFVVAEKTVPSKLCNTFAECMAKSEKTDIYRKKISLYDEALVHYKKTDSEILRARALLNRANATIREALGDTGYKGEIPLKVTHKPEYKTNQFKKATADLDAVKANLNEFSSNERELYEELRNLLQTK